MFDLDSHRLDNKLFHFGAGVIAKPLDEHAGFSRFLIVIKTNDAIIFAILKGQLLLGLLQPQQGSITRPRGGFAYVPQGNTLLSGTIRYNLLFGNPSATDETMLDALRIACADFVLDDPRGLDYPCGERGAGLSEGQAQRITIARALLCQADVLLLDEAFSALDTPTAETILANIRAARPDQTLICITHRESLLPHADQVIHLT